MTEKTLTSLEFKKPDKAGKIYFEVEEFNTVQKINGRELKDTMQAVVAYLEDEPFFTIYNRFHYDFIYNFNYLGANFNKFCEYQQGVDLTKIYEAMNEDTINEKEYFKSVYEKSRELLNLFSNYKGNFKMTTVEKIYQKDRLGDVLEDHGFEDENYKTEYDSLYEDEVPLFYPGMSAPTTRDKRGFETKIYVQDKEPIIILTFENFKVAEGLPFLFLLSGRNNFKLSKSGNLPIILLTIKNKFKDGKIDVEKLKSKLPENRKWVIEEIKKTLNRENEE